MPIRLPLSSPNGACVIGVIEIVAASGRRGYHRGVGIESKYEEPKTPALTTAETASVTSASQVLSQTELLWADAIMYRSQLVPVMNSVIARAMNTTRGRRSAVTHLAWRRLSR